METLNNKGEKEIIILVQSDRSCEMAAVAIDDKCVMSGNFWDFHPGCHGINEYGEFGGHDDLAIRILLKLTKEGKKAKIIKESYKFN
jgi:hypothetical protein